MNDVIVKGDEYYFSIPGLGIPKNRVNNTLCQNLDYLVDWIPKNADSLTFLLEHHPSAFIAQLSILQEILGGIYARWLVNDISKMIKVAELNKIEMCGKLLMPVINKLHTLAIDIQMAQKYHDSSEKNDSQNDRIESLRDIINSMRIIYGLVDGPNEVSDFNKIQDIASTIGELADNELAMPLFAGIVVKDVNRIKAAAKNILETYLQKIDEENVVPVNTAKKILIVDDMPDVLVSLASMLENHFKVFALSDGNEALSFLDTEQSLDAIILDIEMPGMDGFALAKSIRSRDNYKDVPILFLTSNSDKETVITAYAYNAKAFIVKPANKDVIIAKLSGCLT